MNLKPKLIRVTTVPISMNHIMRGQLKYMKQYFDVVGVSSYVEKDIQDIEVREGISVRIVDMKRQISLFSDLISLVKLISLFSKEKPSIVHSHTPKAGLLAMLAAWITRVPVRLHTVAGMPLMEAKGIKRQLLLSIEKMTYFFANRIYSNSQGLAKFMMESKLIEKRKLKVLGAGSSNGLNLKHFHPEALGSPSIQRAKYRKEIGIPENDFVFLFLGRLAQAKGITELVESFIELAEMDLNIHLLLVGPLESVNGPLSPALLELINQHDRIHSPGRAEEIRPVLLAADVFVFPSYREGFPGVLLQAGAMGIPIIASDINGNNELIHHNHDGILIQLNKPKDLVEAMGIYYKSKELRDLHSMRLRAKIEENYGNEIIWNALYHEYKELLNL